MTTLNISKNIEDTENRFRRKLCNPKGEM